MDFGNDMNNAGNANNSYGFDFLKTDHRLDSHGDPLASTASSAEAQRGIQAQAGLLKKDEAAIRALALSVAHKPDLEKQFDVIHFLQAHRSAGCLAPDVIYRATGIDLEDADQNVAKMLQKNPKIRVEQVPDPENPSIQLNTYAYQAKYNNVRDEKTLLAQINRCKNGVRMRDLLDAYEEVENDLQMLITAGDVLAINNTEDKDKILFPRGEAFLVELDGIAVLPKAILDKATPTTIPTSVPSNSTNAAALKSQQTNASLHIQEEVFCVETDVDPRTQLRRGEAINVGGQWFRVSSAVKEGVPLSEQPVRAQAPLSVVSLTDLSKRNELDGYIRPLNPKTIPLDAALKSSSLQNLQQSKRAREKLHKLSHGQRLSTATQLLGSNAHSSNPITLAQSLAASGAAASIASRRMTMQQRQQQQYSNSSSSNNNHNTTSSSSSSAASSTAIHQQRRKDAQLAQQVAMDPALSLYSRPRRHGCTKDVREMYLNMRNQIPEDENELKALLVQHKLLDPNEQMRRPRLAKRANVDNDGKPKKRRYYERKNQRMTNTHLEGTDIGAILRMAQEKQKQGKSVGDGGM